jgi:DNA-binding FadR family transcriptional regulator
MKLETSDRAAQQNRFSWVSSQTLSEQISYEITKSILRGDFKTGDLLPSENELARQFNVSRAAVREAAKTLAMLGLVRRRQGRGTRVAPHDEWRHLAPELLLARTELGSVDELLLALLELRRMFEVQSAGAAAGRATAEQVDELSRHLKAMDLAGQDINGFTKHDVDFHATLLKAAGNPLLPPLFEQLRPLLELARQLSARSRPGFAHQAQEGHRAIFEAVRVGDADLARTAMSDHLSWTGSLEFKDRELPLRPT